MGNIYKLTCECGYTKECSLGGGLSARNIDVIKRVFSEDEPKNFFKFYDIGCVMRYGLERKAAICPVCQELYDIETLRYELVDGSQKEIVQKCPVCSGELELGTDLTCPKCANALKIEEIGHWD